MCQYSHQLKSTKSASYFHKEINEKNSFSILILIKLQCQILMWHTVQLAQLQFSLFQFFITFLKVALFGFAKVFKDLQELFCDHNV